LNNTEFESSELECLLISARQAVEVMKAAVMRDRNVATTCY